MNESEIADNLGAAAACWFGARLGGGFVSSVILFMARSCRCSVTRGRALVATCVWTVVPAIYHPVLSTL
jgi:hypothetical protein